MVNEAFRGSSMSADDHPSSPAAVWPSRVRGRVRRHVRRSAGPLFCALIVAILAVGCSTAPPADGPSRVSRFGEYSGYSVAAFDAWNRYSVYVPMDDGAKLAVDYYLPTAAGIEAETPLPVVLHYTRYGRAFEGAGGLVTQVERDASLQHLLRHGYAVAVADSRGSGASFGVHDGPLPAAETRDSYLLIEWLAAQPWCDGKVGMHGRSYPGVTQYHAASQSPPHLKAIFPEMAGPSPYDFIFDGGTLKEGFVRVWGAYTARLDAGDPDPPARVDADLDGSERDAALAEHAANLGPEAITRIARFRDSVVERPNGETWSWSIAAVLDDTAAIDASGVAIYHVAGWFDTYTTQQPMMFANLRSTPQKMVIGPWVHTGGLGGRLLNTEILRWYDYWLKGIDNGIMDEAPVHYWVLRGDNSVPEDPEQRVSRDEAAAEAGTGWAASGSWPPDGCAPRRYYLAGGPSGTVASANDGTLTQSPPQESEAADRHAVDLAPRGGSLTRWTNSYGARRADRPGTTFFDEWSADDARSLTYTTAPLDEELTVTGYPEVELWVSSTHPDGDYFVFLEEVDSAGRSHYLTEGALRASHRLLADPPFENFGLPYHPSTEATLMALPASPVALVIDLMGTAAVIDAGHRLRLTIAGASPPDYEVFPDPTDFGAPVITVHRDRARPSLLRLPVCKLTP